MTFKNDENIDQATLRNWIAAGLSIPGVRVLNGDAGYLLNNMIAKYTLAASCYMISELALKEFEVQRVDLSMTYTRHKFYGKQKGKNPFIYEHAIPATIIRSQLLSKAYNSDDVKSTLVGAGQVAVLLRLEDEKMRKAGFRSQMPSGWKFGDDPLARYHAVGIKLSPKVLKVTGAICR